ncbi:MAG: glycine--tRNA ligase subunit beta, partial [Pseudomonadota bacterium]|nr:glycine--tRNA ligase subunit beta [Pseudomonadota bacterium]
MNLESLLIEVLTEELPPKILADLSQSFANTLWDNLKNRDFLSASSQMIPYATPRRLAVHFSFVSDEQPDQVIIRRGPSVKASFDAAGRPTPALLGFARSIAVDPDSLEREVDGKGEYLVARVMQDGERLDVLLAGLVEEALKKLPAPRLMRWGDHDFSFVRPVHGLVMIYGDKVIPGSVLGQVSGCLTFGHRYMSNGPVMIGHADSYERELGERGKVIPSFSRRKEIIVTQLKALAVDYKARVLGPPFEPGEGLSPQLADCLGGDVLLDEVTALVEYPKVYVGHFPKEFLDIPVECLTLTMKQNQKYFPMVGNDGQLMPSFMMVANLDPVDSMKIIHGNERVLRARLEDARFFFYQDQKRRLDERVSELEGVIYHNKLGNMLLRVARISSLAEKLARTCAVDEHLVQRAAWLCKADLLTGMVGEFPELQGVMGGYYARVQGEPEIVTRAIQEHYLPRFSGDRLPDLKEATCLALADKLEMLAGFFSIGIFPTGDKDPFGLRRQAIGILRILIEKPFSLSLPTLLHQAVEVHLQEQQTPVVDALYAFMLERLKFYLRELGYAPDEIEAVTILRLS